MDIIQLGLLILMAAFACVAVFAKDLLRAAISLAFVSALLAVVLFRLNSPYAGVFELSVVAGLVTVLFVSTIALTSHERAAEEPKWPRYVFPLVLVLFGLIDLVIAERFFGAMTRSWQRPVGDFGSTLWGARAMDIVGQIAVIFGGVFGVLALLREKAPSPEDAVPDRGTEEGGKLW
jgi:NADH-quinone oxidoreductase subunit J